MRYAQVKWKVEPPAALLVGSEDDLRIDALGAEDNVVKVVVGEYPEVLVQLLHHDRRHLTLVVLLQSRFLFGALGLVLPLDDPALIRPDANRNCSLLAGRDDSFDLRAILD